MKRIVLILSIFASLSSYAQGIDSTKQNIALTGIQVRDWEYIVQIITGDLYDPLLDSLKSRFRKTPSLSNQTVVSIDSVERREILSLHFALRTEWTGSFSFSRVDAAIRAMNDPYINSQLVIIDNNFQSTTTARRKYGRDKLDGKRN